MRFLSRSEVRKWFDGKTVAVVGSGPGCLDNGRNVIDGCDVVLRCNNYKLLPGTGRRTDVFYSFFGSSIKKSADELKHDGVKMCMCKIPNAHAIESEWHRKNNKMIGVDYRPHFRRREGWWFCDTYIPTVDEFLLPFNALGRHQPSTGFAAIFDVLSFSPAAVHLTGFDFFTSKIHNVNEPHRLKNLDDPIGHSPEREIKWLRENISRHNVTTDKRLAAILAG